MFIVVDASVWVSRLVSDDAFHELIKDWMASQREQGTELVSPFLLLVEVGGAISRKTGIPELGLNAVKQVENLPGVRLVEMDNSLLKDAANLAAELGLRGADATYVATAARLNLPMVTLDKDQRERASKRIKILNVI